MSFWTIFFAVIAAVFVLALSPYILMAAGALLYVVWWLLFGWWVNWFRRRGL